MDGRLVSGLLQLGTALVLLGLLLGLLLGWGTALMWVAGTGAAAYALGLAAGVGKLLGGIGR